MRLHLDGRLTPAAMAVAVMVLTGAGVLPTKVAISGPAQRRAAMLAAGVDTMPVGTAAGVERARLARPKD